MLTLFTPIMSGVGGSWPGLSACQQSFAGVLVSWRRLDAAKLSHCMTWNNDHDSLTHSVQQLNISVGDTAVW